MMKERKLLLKIGVPVLIVVIVAGIFIFKKLNKGDNLNSKETQATQQAGETTMPLEDASVSLDKLKSYKLPFVVDFGASWCGPCRQFEPTLEKIHSEMQGKAVIQYVDVDENSTFADNFPFQVIPTQFFFTKDGNPFVPSDTLSQEIEFTLYKDKTTNAHTFTYHEGALTEDEFRAILKEMGVT